MSKPVKAVPEEDGRRGLIGLPGDGMKAVEGHDPQRDEELTHILEPAVDGPRQAKDVGPDELRPRHHEGPPPPPLVYVRQLLAGQTKSAGQPWPASLTR